MHVFCQCRWILVLLFAVVLTGCGTTKSRKGTEQLLMSNAVDLAVAEIDFRPLTRKKVYFDTQYIRNVKGMGFVNADYIISSLRQQVVAARCLLQDEIEEADYIIEARVGALGTDGHDLTFGIPASNAVSTAASILPTAPPVPAIPEISFGRKSDQQGSAKIGVFAYHRETREPVWQSGISQARSTAKDTWLLGAGPFQRGTIYNGTQFAGSKVKVPLVGKKGKKNKRHPLIAYDREYDFRAPLEIMDVSKVRVVDYEEEDESDTARPLRQPNFQSGRE